MTKHNDQERALFEAAAEKHRVECLGFKLAKLDSGSYFDNETRMLWEVWKLSRAQLPAGGAVPEPVEIAAFLMEPDLYEPYVSLSRDSRCNGSVEALMTVSQHNRIVAQLAAAPHPVSGEQKEEFFVDHAILRKALGMYGIAAPESDHELGDRMESYAIKVIKAVARLPFPAAQGVSGLALIEAGNPLSNLAYNLAQKPGHALTAYDCELLSELRKRWDEALAAHRAKQGEQP